MELRDLKEGMDRRFEAVDQRFEAVDRRFEAVDQRFEAVDQRFDAVDQRFDAVDRRLEETLAFVVSEGEKTRRYVLEESDRTRRYVFEQDQETRRYFDVVVEQIKSERNLTLDKAIAADERAGRLTVTNAAEHEQLASRLDDHELRLGRLERKEDQ